ncbi:MAG: DUF454 domain-containing protein [Actinomycetia bacterium]|nr:DUF454 domain-containing protein [Actinomycetes bacterium]
MSDHEGEATMATGPLRWSLLVVGFLAVGLGGLGVVLPILPTTPFVLLAALCFSRSSRRFHKWLVTNRVFGPLIVDWEQGRSISAGVKTSAIISMIIVGGASIVWVIDSLWGKIAMALTLAAVGAWIVTRPTTPRSDQLKKSL